MRHVYKKNTVIAEERRCGLGTLVTRLFSERVQETHLQPHQNTVPNANETSNN